VQGDPDWVNKGLEWVVEQGVAVEVMDEKTAEG